LGGRRGSEAFVESGEIDYDEEIREGVVEMGGVGVVEDVQEFLCEARNVKFCVKDRGEGFTSVELDARRAIKHDILGIRQVPVRRASRTALSKRQRA